MNKKERVIAAINKKPVDYVPCGFSLHFPENENSGKAGVEAHLRFFKEADTDIDKIMNENLVPSPAKGSVFPEGYAPVAEMDLVGTIIKEQVEFSKEIISKLDGSSFVMGTLHGICASGLHPIEKSGYAYEDARKIQRDSLLKDEVTTLKAFQHITDAMCELAKGYKEAGCDAVYFASLGGEHDCFTPEEFDHWIKPYDLQIMKAINDAGLYCVLHICKSGIDMERYRDYGKYADVVNWGVYEIPYSLEDGRKLFPDAAIMGGLKNRSGVLVDGTDEEIAAEVKDVINGFGKTGFILGADCTLATEQDMHKLSVAIKTSREC